MLYRWHREQFTDPLFGLFLDTWRVLIFQKFWVSKSVGEICSPFLGGSCANFAAGFGKKMIKKEVRWVPKATAERISCTILEELS